MNMVSKLVHSLGLPLSIVLGLFFPFGKDLNFLVTPILAFLLFASLLKIDSWRNDFDYKSVIKVFLAIILISVGVFFVGKSLNFSNDWLIGFVLVALAPAAISSPVIIGHIRKGNVALGLQVSLATNVLAILYIPVVFFLLFRKEITIDPFVMGRDLALIVGIPMVLAYFVKKIGLKGYIAPVIGKLSFLFLCFVVWIIFSKNSDFLLMKVGEYWLYFIALFGLAVVNYVVGYFVSKSGLTTAVSMGHKNTVLTVWLCTTFFSPQVALVPTIYIICHHLINSLLLSFRGEKKL